MDILTPQMLILLLQYISNKAQNQPVPWNTLLRSSSVVEFLSMEAKISWYIRLALLRVIITLPRSQHCINNDKTKPAGQCYVHNQYKVFVTYFSIMDVGEGSFTVTLTVSVRSAPHCLLIFILLYHISVTFLYLINFHHFCIFTYLKKKTIIDGRTNGWTHLPEKMREIW